MTKNQLEYLGLVETKRNNLVVSDETQRHNKAVEGETGRHNLVTEGQTQQQINETNRHNLVTEGQTDVVNAETSRHNKATEQLTKSANKETKRHNKKTESNTLKVANINKSTAKYNADKSAQATKYAANRNAEASKYAANQSRVASMYATDIRHSDEIGERILKTDLSRNQLKNQKEIAELQTNTQKYIKGIDELIAKRNMDTQNKKILKEYKAKLIDTYSKLATANQANSIKLAEVLIKLVGSNKISSLLK